MACFNAPSNTMLVGRAVKELALAVEWLPEDWPEVFRVWSDC